MIQFNPNEETAITMDHFDQAMNNAAAEVISFKRMILQYREETT